MIKIQAREIHVKPFATNVICVETSTTLFVHFFLEYKWSASPMGKTVKPKTNNINKSGAIGKSGITNGLRGKHKNVMHDNAIRKNF